MNWRIAQCAGALLWMTFSANAHAELSQAEYCRTHAMGITVTMKTAVGLSQPRAVALEQAGLAKGGPSYALATLAHSRLEGGAKVAAVTEEVRAACLRADYRKLLADKPTFDGAASGEAGAQLCSDLATSMSGFLAGDRQAAAMPVDDALDAYAPREHSDTPAPRPRLRTAMQLTQQFARTSPDARKIADFAMRHCNSLDASARTELDGEFYAP